MLRAALITFLALLPASVTAQNEPLSLFTAFKTFCVDTGALPDRVNTAVKASGGTAHRAPITSPGMSAMSGAPFPLTLWTWEIEFYGHKMLVSTGRSYPSRKFTDVKHADFDSCSLTSFANEDASVKAIQDWLGIKPTSSDIGGPHDKWVPDLSQYHYSWKGKIKPSPTKSIPDEKSLDRDQPVWGLVLLRDPHGASVQFTHTLSEAASTPTP